MYTFSLIQFTYTTYSLINSFIQSVIYFNLFNLYFILFYFILFCEQQDHVFF